MIFSTEADYSLVVVAKYIQQIGRVHQVSTTDTQINSLRF